MQTKQRSHQVVRRNNKPDAYNITDALSEIPIPASSPTSSGLRVLRRAHRLRTESTYATGDLPGHKM
ncbi:hypothetical protein SISSUDRAFT_1051101 [Sistotremastrum suecicum HHB10207 ss-3]|uniref:Uncharacterized protein n=1 Tax=Sistotremastrum suecicum HHB10207 ss-3 TaxID=1314776 RepID=A0A166AS30_9AGAM|nr:hypothetical protein SISSUDRAFT_1051101 [Sistotremastrum suecicum HHB10207 ss-3]